ncbi:MAG: hypothetical protein WDN46_05310 [Methylocella sp.]
MGNPVPQVGGRTLDYGSFEFPIVVPPYAQDYLKRALRGEILPDEIEAELKANGLPPLATEPDPAKFDPMPEIWWTLPMTAAWVIWRTPHAVRRAWWPYRREVRIWIGPREYDVVQDKQTEPGILGEPKALHIENATGYTLERLSNLHLFQVLLRSTFNDPDDGVPLVTGKEAKVDLWRPLQSGHLIANGIPPREARRVAIPHTDWIDIDQYYQEGWPTDAVGRILEPNPIFVGVRVNRERVVELWPDRNSAEPSAVVPRSIRQSDRREAIRVVFNELWPDGLPVGLMVKERDAQIIELLKQKGLRPPSDRTIHRALTDT